MVKTITDQSLVNRIRRGKSSKGRRILEKREPQLVEEVKKLVLYRSSTASQDCVQLLRDITALKKPHAVYLQRKEAWLPFENPGNLEFVTLKNEGSLFAYASHSKKRPNNLTLGRIYDGHILDMVEFGFENYKSLSEFHVQKISTETKPIILFSGELFENAPDFQRLKSLLLDFFTGANVDQVNLNGLEHVIHFVEVDRVICMRSYKVVLKKSGVKLPRVELEEIGPRLDLTLRRTNLASLDLFKKALRQPEQVLKQSGRMKKPEEKNLSKDVFGTKLGRIHMERQDYNRLRLRKGGAYKATLRTAQQ